MSYINKIQKNNVNYDIQDARVPEVGSSDKDKVLHTNATTGALEWVQGGGGSGAGAYAHSYIVGMMNAETGDGEAILIQFNSSQSTPFLGPTGSVEDPINLYEAIANKGIMDSETGDTRFGLPRYSNTNLKISDDYMSVYGALNPAYVQPSDIEVIPNSETYVFGTGVLPVMVPITRCELQNNDGVYEMEYSGIYAGTDTETGDLMPMALSDQTHGYSIWAYNIKQL